MSRRGAARKSLLSSLGAGHIIVDDNMKDSVYGAQYFKLDPKSDFPKANGTGAVVLKFAPSPHDVDVTESNSTLSASHSPSNATPEEPPSAKRKPLRMAISSTGLSKEICQTYSSGANQFDVWPPNSLVNFAVSGEDTSFLTGEDALISAHVTDDSDTRHQYVQLSIENLSKGLFNHVELPLPVFKHAFSRTAQERSATPTLSAGETRRVVLAVADGVGGMAAMGDKNETKEMSHQLMRLVRQHLTSDTESARELLGQAFYSLIASNNVALGACTTALALIKPTKRVEPEDEFDDGFRLSLSIANAGDSAVIAFRPKPYGRSGQYSYIPLALSWPMHHKWHTGNPPPFQFTLPPVEMQGLRPDTVKEMQNVAGTNTTSHYHTPTTAVGEKCPSGGDHVYINKFDYRQIFAGKRELADHFRTKDKLVSLQRDFINSIGDIDVDNPWLAQGPDHVRLRRGDIVCVFSDGIADNLRTATFTNAVSEVWESLMGYVNPGVRQQHPLTRHVRSFRDDGHSNLGHLLLPKDGVLSKPEITAYSKQFLSNTSSIYDSAVQKGHGSENLVPRESSLDDVTEDIVAGTLSSMLAGGVTRLCQKGWKVDDMSIVVGVIY